MRKVYKIIRYLYRHLNFPLVHRLLLLELVHRFRPLYCNLACNCIRMIQDYLCILRFRRCKVTIGIHQYL